MSTWVSQPSPQSALTSPMEPNQTALLGEVIGGLKPLFKFADPPISSSALEEEQKFLKF